MRVSVVVRNRSYHYQVFILLAEPLAAALAADTAAVGKCLIGNCPAELAQCLADPSCVQNLVCLQTCNGKTQEEESACQVCLHSDPQLQRCSCVGRSHPIWMHGAGCMSGQGLLHSAGPVHC